MSEKTKIFKLPSEEQEQLKVLRYSCSVSRERLFVIQSSIPIPEGKLKIIVEA